MKLKELRQQKNLTQEELSKNLDMPRTKYARYELGTSEPNIETLIKLSDYYHTTVDEILGHEVPYLINKSQFTQTQLEIIKKIKNLSEEACKRVDAYIMGIMAGEEQRNILQNFKRGDYE